MPISTRITAFTLPAILILIGFILLVFEGSADNSQMGTLGWLLIVVAVVIQFLSILGRK